MSQQKREQTLLDKSLTNSRLNSPTQADMLLEEALEAQSGQVAAFESFPLESQFSAALAAQLESKHDQAERIEDRLENLIENQASRIQQTQSNQPSLFALPSTKARWQQSLQKQQQLMLTLHNRLEAVREIKEGMGVHGPKLEALAMRKLRADEPDLVKEWEEMQEARRLHEALKERNAKEKHRLQTGKSNHLHLGLSRELAPK